MRAAVTSFHSQLPVKIAFGDGVIQELPAVFAEHGVQRAFLVIEQPVVKNDGVERALAACRAAGVQVEQFVKGPGEPTFLQADELATAILAGAFEIVVGIGGGSALDLAKAARIGADQGLPIRAYADGKTVELPRLPLVLCPTTSGTGSEVSGASVLTDTERGQKVGFGHPLMRAQHALVDPRLTIGLPPAPTSHSGVDALAQAIGACTVTDGSPLSIAFGLEAVHHVGGSLERAVADGSDLDARAQLACASLTAGLAMNLSDCAADHALGQALGSLKHLPHGLTVGLVLAECLDVVRVDCADRLERVADALGEPADGSADGSRAVRAVRRLLAAISFPTLGEVGVADSDIAELTELALTEQAFFFTVDCHAWTRDEVAGAYRAALAVTAR